jgi:isopropylmalate/homocitrate/citramalate synthase
VGEVVSVAERLPADELVLADTIGVAAHGQVRRLVERVRAGTRVGFHGHNTRGQVYRAGPFPTSSA